MGLCTSDQFTGRAFGECWLKGSFARDKFIEVITLESLGLIRNLTDRRNCVFCSTEIISFRFLIYNLNKLDLNTNKKEITLRSVAVY